MTRRVTIVVGAWRRALSRHTRLNIAIVACCGLMLVLAIALILALGGLSGRASTALDTAEAWSAASATAAEGSLLFDQWRGDGAEVHAELAGLLDRLAAQVEPVDPEGRTDVAGEAARLGDVSRTHLESAAAGEPGLAVDAEVLANDFGDLAEELAAEGEAASQSTIQGIRTWLWGIQIAAVLAAVVFSVVVATQILPLTRSINRSMSDLRNWNAEAAADSRRRTLAGQVIDGLDGSTDEASAHAVVARAMQVAAPTQAAEMLLADSSHAHLRVAVAHPVNGAPGCGVRSPWSCPAVRRGTTQVFADSGSVRACPHLSEGREACSAVCAPMAFMGQPMGVLHVTGPPGVPAPELVESMTMLATESATRLGTLRAFAKAELQAATDVQTGLPNRRSTEDRLKSLLNDPAGGVAAIIEFVGRPSLDGRSGQSATDRALRVATEALTGVVRGGDWCGRWGASEFVVILPGVGAAASHEILERLVVEVREALAAANVEGVSVAAAVVDTRRAETAHAMMALVSEALSEARGELAANEKTEIREIFSDPQLSAP